MHAIHNYATIIVQSMNIRDRVWSVGLYIIIHYTRIYTDGIIPRKIPVMEMAQAPAYASNILCILYKVRCFWIFQQIKVLIFSYRHQ